ncbi:MAG: DUF4062 domain-containing protein [Lachnospiraceae bacterium]|nr:DUF4062 domain-containing protein [Lachnospiraceae bacterium]
MSNIAFFLSSTFNDMQSERDLIREKITPEIERELKNFGINVEFIDLRWGIDTKNIAEAEANKKILKTCFDEIKSTKPFFIAFIGERYGWIPESTDVEDACKDSAIDITSDYLEKSITELEILCAQKSYPAMDRCLFYFREPVDYGDDEVAKNLYVSYGKEQEKLIALKKRLAEKYPTQIRSYNAVWNTSEQRIEGLELLEQRIFDDIKLSVKWEISNEYLPSNDIERSNNILFGTIERLSKSFSGRKNEISAIEKFIENNDERILLVSGDSGCGKSSLLAQVVSIQKDSNHIVVPFFVGVDEHSYSVEDMMQSVVYRLSQILHMPLCFDPKSTIFDVNEVVKQFNFLLNQSSLVKKTILVIDALNQFTDSLYEKNLKWLNLFALSPKVKIILSATTDYYQLKHIKALNAQELNLNYFTNEDIEDVVKKYFKANRKEINSTLLNEILNKQINKVNPCGQPLYLMTLLQELNNIGAEDFKQIKNREATKGENAAEAIINYLNEIVREAPCDLFLQLDKLFKKVLQKVNSEICEVVVCAIALSRRGISERFIEKICVRLGYEFHTTTFSYFRKLFKNHLCQSENGAWDFNHSLVKRFFFDKYNEKQLKADVLQAILDCLLVEPDDLPFKCTEYCHYLSLLDKLDIFVPYYSSMKDNEQVKRSFINEMLELNGSKITNKLFVPVTECTTDIWEFFCDSLKNQTFGAKASEIYAHNVLCSIYSTEYSADKLKLEIVFKVYSGIGFIALQSGFYSIAKDYLLMASQILRRINRTEYKFEVYSKLATCYFYLGNELLRKKYWRLAKSSLENSSDLCVNLQIITELINAYYNDCLQKIDEIVINKKPIKKLLIKIQDLLQLQILAQNEKVIWYSRILYLSSFVDSFKEKDELVLYCLNYDSDTLDNLAQSEVFYNLGIFYANFDFKKAYELLQKAYDKVILALQYEESEDALKLLNNILESEQKIVCIKGNNAAGLVLEQLSCLKKINVLTPDYDSLNKHISIYKSGKHDNTDIKGIKTLRRNLARGEMSAEHKVANKILITLIVSVVLFFLIMLPVAFVFFRAYVIKWSIDHRFTSLYSFFVNYYFQAVFETFFNLFICLCVYGLLQIFKLGNDYKLKQTWAKRCTILAILSFAVLIVYYILWNNFETQLVIDKNFRDWEINCLSLILSGLLLLMLICNELFTFVTKERILHNRLVNYTQFVTNYRNKVLSYLVNIAVLALTIILYWLASGAFIDKGFLSDTTGPMLVLPVFWFKVASIAVAGIMIGKIIYLTIVRFVLKVRYGKDFKN